MTPAVKKALEARWKIKLESLDEQLDLVRRNASAIKLAVPAAGFADLEDVDRRLKQLAESAAYARVVFAELIGSAELAMTSSPPACDVSDGGCCTCRLRRGHKGKHRDGKITWAKKKNDDAIQVTFEAEIDAEINAASAGKLEPGQAFGRRGRTR